MSGLDFKCHWLGGACPVQAEGTICGRPWYFRARFEHWSMTVGNVGDQHALESEAWCYEQEYGDGLFAAGWMPEDEARGFIVGSIMAWLAEQVPA